MLKPVIRQPSLSQGFWSWFRIPSVSLLEAAESIPFHCEDDQAPEIIEADADSVLALKGNQPTVLNEDQSRARHKNAGENLATLRRWSLSLIKADKLKAKRSLKSRGKCAGWDNAYLLHLLGIH